MKKMLNEHQLKLLQSMVSLIEGYLNGQSQDFNGLVGKLEGALDASEIKDKDIIKRWYDLWTPLEELRSVETTAEAKSKLIEMLIFLRELL